MRLAYNDAMSFNAATNTGGANGSIYRRAERRHPVNSDLVVRPSETSFLASDGEQEDLQTLGRARSNGLLNFCGFHLVRRSGSNLAK